MYSPLVYRCPYNQATLLEKIQSNGVRRPAICLCENLLLYVMLLH